MVKNREPIVYALIDPDQIESGSIKAIPKERLKKAELSVCRAWEATAVEAWENIMQGQLAKNHQRKDAGYIWASAGEIRKIRLTDVNAGAFCVIDDGLKNFKAHAVLGYSPAPEGYDPVKMANERLAARGNLLKLFEGSGVKNWNEWSFN